MHHSNVCQEHRAENLVKDILDKVELVQDDDGGYDEADYVQEEGVRVSYVGPKVHYAPQQLDQ